MKIRVAGNTVENLLYAAALGWALWFVGAFTILALMRAGIDFDLEWMEGLMLEQTRRVMEGRNLYPPPSYEYVPGPYPPLYFYVSAVFSYIFGSSHLPLRLVSTVSTLASCGALYAFVRRESGHRLPGLLAAGLFAATWRINAYWLDLARVDMISTAFTLWGAYLLRFSQKRSHDVLAALFFVAAVLSKQSAVIPAAALFVWVLLKHRRALPAFLAASLLSGTAAFLLFYAIYGEWFVYYLLKVPASHGIIQHRIPIFWKTDWLQPFGLASLVALWFFFKRGDDSAEKPGALSFYSIFALACLLSTFLQRIKVGGAYNSMIPLHSAVALLAGLSVAAAAGCSEGRLRGFLSAVCILQFASLAYQPGRFLPSPEVYETIERTRSIVAAMPGETYVMRNPNILNRPEGPGAAHMCAAEDVLKETERFQENRQAILKPFIHRRYDAVLIHPHQIPDYCRKVLLKYYEPTKRRLGIVMWQNENGFTVDGEIVYTLKEEFKNKDPQRN